MPSGLAVGFGFPPAMALDDTEEAWPEDPFGGEGAEEEQEEYPDMDEEQPAADGARASSVVKGELPNADEAGSATAPKDMPAGDMLGEVKRPLPDESKDMPMYDPTSPAEEDEDVQDSKDFAAAAAPGRSGHHDATATETAWHDGDSTHHPGVDRVDTTEAAWPVTSRIPQKRPQGPPAAVEKEHKIVPCPVLLVGSHLDKECQLYPGRWVEVGRHAKAHVLMQNAAVSMRHCKLMWKRGASAVELRVVDGVTYVNDKRLNIGASTSLTHGDLIKIQGKGVCFRLLVDMCVVNSRLPPVKSMASYIAAVKDSGPIRSPEEESRLRIRKLRAAAAKARQNAMEYEARLIEVNLKRAMRVQKSEEELEKGMWFEKDAERLDGVLETSRDEWLERLQAQSEAHDLAMRPLNDMTMETQTKRDSLTILKNQQDRALHPERHMELAGSAMLPLVSGGSPRKSASSAGSPVKKASRFAARDGEADGEEEVFGDKSLDTQEDKVAFEKPTIEVLKTAPITSDNEIANLFGDFDSEEEEEQQAKRMKFAVTNSEDTRQMAMR